MMASPRSSVRMPVPVPWRIGRIEVPKESRGAVKDVVRMRVLGKDDGNWIEGIGHGIGTQRGRSQRQNGIVEEFAILKMECPAFPKVSLTSHSWRSLGGPEANHEMLELEAVSKIRRRPRPAIGQHSAIGSPPRGFAANRRNSCPAGVGTGSSGSEAGALGRESAEVRGTFEIGLPMSYLSTLPMVGAGSARLCLPPASSFPCALPGRVAARFHRRSFLSDS